MSYTFEKDRLAKYLAEYIKGYLFVEFSDEFMKRLNIEDVAKGVRVPIDPRDLKRFSGGSGVSATEIAGNMVRVVGCDPNFKYANAYKKFMGRFFNERLPQDVLMTGVKAVEAGNMQEACIHFRAALFLEPDMMEAMYNYARVCREMYNSSDDEIFIGMCKAESTEAFEKLTEDYPDFDQPYFFLGYAYLNMGLYEKAGLAWEKFLPIAKDHQAAQEAAQRLREIAEPRRIEAGCNAVISGRYAEGIGILSGFAASGYETWWPLHFYLGVAYEEVGNMDAAEREYKRTLQLNAADMGSMEGLIRIYKGRGQDELAEKYEKKKSIIEENLRADAQEQSENPEANSDGEK